MGSYVILWPFISAIAAAGLVIVDKHLLSKRNLPIKEYVSFLFIMIYLLMLPFVLFGLGGTLKELNTKIFLLFAVTVAVAVGWNIIYYRAIKIMQVQEFELINLLSPLATAFLGILFFPSERKLAPVIAAFGAIAVLMLAHFKKGHLKLDNQTPILVVSVILIAVEAALWVPLLKVVSPFLFYFIRCGAIAIVFLLAWKPSIRVTTKHGAWWLIILAAVIAIIQMVSRMYGFKDVGLIPTMAALAITPGLVYLLDALIIKEKIKTKYMISAAFIVILAILAQPGVVDKFVKFAVG